MKSFFFSKVQQNSQQKMSCLVCMESHILQLLVLKRSFQHPRYVIDNEKCLLKKQHLEDESLLWTYLYSEYENETAFYLSRIQDEEEKSKMVLIVLDNCALALICDTLPTILTENPEVNMLMKSLYAKKRLGLLLLRFRTLSEENVLKCATCLDNMFTAMIQKPILYNATAPIASYLSNCNSCKTEEQMHILLYTVDQICEYFFIH